MLERIDGAEPHQRSELNSLTSLRWFAASVVFLRHVEPLLSGGPLSQLSRGIGRAGPVGVSFFFLLSGFILSWSHRPPVRPRSFYRRRFARIFPAYVTACVIAIPVVLYVSPKPTHEVAGLVASFTGLQAWVPDRSLYYGGDGVLWSLSAELFFYLLFPVIAGRILNAAPRRRLMLLAVFATVSVTLPLLLHPHTDGSGLAFWAIYINPAYRIFEFLIGICLCGFCRDGFRIRVSLPVAAAIAGLGYLGAAVVPLYAMWVCVTLAPFGLLIYVAAQSDLAGRTGRLLTSPILITLGRWSFSFYLLHQLIIRVVDRAVLSGAQPGLGVQLACAIGSYLVSIAAAGLLFQFIEAPAANRLRVARPRSARRGRQTLSVSTE